MLERNSCVQNVLDVLVRFGHMDMMQLTKQDSEKQQ